MPAQKKDNWMEYFNRLNKTLNNFEIRIENLERKVAAISKKSAAAEPETETTFESNPKRVTGWVLIWAFVALLLSSFFGFGILSAFSYFFGYTFQYLILFAALVIGIVLVVSNPKKAVTGVKRAKEEIDLGQDALYADGEKPKAAKKAEARAASLKKASKPQTKGSMEADIGKKWLPKIGVASIVLGVAFFVVYAIQNKWIGPTGQVALGVLAGIALIISGEIFYRREYENYGLTLVGGGFAIIYFAMFSAYRFYNLLNLWIDIASLSIIIAAAVYFAVRYDSKIIAAEAFFLGYIAPLLTSNVNTFFLIYSTALTAGLSALTYFKKWKTLGAGGMAAMYITHIFWLGDYAGQYKSQLHLVFLAIYIVMFAVMAWSTKDNIQDKIEAAIDSKYLITGSLVATYLFLFALDFTSVLIVMTPLVVLLLGITFLVIKFRWEYYAVGAIAMTYIVHWNWLSQNFGPSVTLVNFIATSVYFLLFNILLFAVYDSNKVENVIAIVLNSFIYYSLNLWPVFYFSKGYDGLFTALIAVFFLVFSYLAYSKKAKNYFNTCLVLCFGYLTLAVPLQFNREWITISWAVLALLLVALSLKLKENAIRISSSAVAIITLTRLLFYDSWKLHAVDFSNLLNSTRMFAFAFSILIFYIIAYLYYKNKDEFVDYDKYVAYVNASYAIAATVLTTIIIWIEIWDTSLALNAKKLWTSLSFITQAIVILGFGFSAKIKLFRVLGLILFGLSIFKVFLYDLSNLDTGYRIISFIVLGVIALLGAFLYNKYKEYI